LPRIPKKEGKRRPAGSEMKGHRIVRKGKKEPRASKTFLHVMERRREEGIL